MFILSLLIKIAVSTAVMYFSIGIADRGNYRNTPGNALMFTLALITAQFVPFLYFAGLIIWVYILINWYSVGFFRSFLCVMVYFVLMLLLRILLSITLLSGAFTISRMTDLETTREQWREFRQEVSATVEDLYRGVMYYTGLRKTGGEAAEPEPASAGKTGVTVIRLKSGRRLRGRVIMSNQDGVFLEIEGGTAEILIPRTMIESIDRE
ncbi:MAG: hypothetical protein GF392_00610 [Candidatus Omnitrophica bacterium]|nr:hypothetical protein [Candidatus Omnitrophota bacterium]